MSFDPRRHTPWLVVAWWAALMGAVIAVRPLTPVDETRVVAVAWEMRQSGNWLVLHLNGALYGHKPPLIYWLINLGWTVFGVNEWWPRLLTGLFGAGALVVVVALARRLAPRREDIAAMTVMITASALGWVVFTGAVMFDLVLAFFVALGMLGVVRAAEAQRGAWSLVGAAIGLGILTKGPVALLHILPAALLAPLWLAAPPAARPGWGRWYRGVGLAVLVGAAIALAWAVPTAIVGGEAFRREIFWSQSVDRIVSSDHHARPFWYYLPLLPVLLSPWLIFLPVWRGLAALAKSERLLAARFALIWGGAVLLGFSLFKTKLIYYLLPATPAFALLAAAGIAALETAPRRIETALIGALLGLAAVAITALPRLPRLQHLLSVGESPLLWTTAAVLALTALLLLAWRPRERVATVAFVGTASVIAVLGAYAGIVRAVVDGYDVAPVAQELARVQAAGQPVAHHGKYHGQFQFVGRLARPLEVVPRADDLLAWAARHPDGSVVVYSYQPLTHPGARPQATQKFKGRFVYVWRAGDLPGVSSGWLRERGGDDAETG
jgi:4-amino-4-deoxy-L-arabinose transferase-like glycosyltransferase